MDQPSVAEGVAGLQVVGLSAVCLLVLLDQETAAVPHKSTADAWTQWQLLSLWWQETVSVANFFAYVRVTGSWFFA